MRKAKSNGGFSLLEMLMTTLILSFSMVMLVNGSVSIRRIYSETLRKADAQMMLSEAETQLRNDLSFTKKYKTEDNNENGKLTEYCKYSVWYPLSKEFAAATDALQAEKQRRLEGLTIPVNDLRVTKSGDYFTVSGLRVEADGKTIQSGDAFDVRALSVVQFVASGQ